MACLRAGAQDLLLKSNLSHLSHAIAVATFVRRPLEKLTRRQIDVLRLVAEGHRTRAIASHLKLSVKTVESHRGAVMKRLGIHDVVSLVRFAVHIGLISAAALKCSEGRARVGGATHPLPDGRRAKQVLPSVELGELTLAT
ncbi:MAG: hypothetical protein NVSMB53_05530 [Gemmatimonadaceae bacterium]